MLIFNLDIEGVLLVPKCLQCRDFYYLLFICLYVEKKLASFLWSTNALDINRLLRCGQSLDVDLAYMETHWVFLFRKTSAWYCAWQSQLWSYRHLLSDFSFLSGTRISIYVYICIHMHICSHIVWPHFLALPLIGGVSLEVSRWTSLYFFNNLGVQVMLLD